MGSSYHQLFYHFVWIYMCYELILEIALQGGLLGTAPGFNREILEVVALEKHYILDIITIFHAGNKSQACSMQAHLEEGLH